jgi:hypothetical protein
MKIFLAILMTLALASCQSAQQKRAVATSNAQAFATNIKGTVLDCSGIDSDNNGYVSCSVQGERATLHELECSTEPGAGCKVRPAVIVD